MKHTIAVIGLFVSLNAQADGLLDVYEAMQQGAIGNQQSTEAIGRVLDRKGMNPNPAPVPLPASVMLLGAGLTMLAIRRKGA